MMTILMNMMMFCSISTAAAALNDIVPNYKGCVSDLAKAQAYCDESKTIDERVDLLLKELTLEEKINSISPQPALGDTCGDHTAGKTEIGLPDYFWLTETNSNVAAHCYSEKYKCPSTFVGPLGMVSNERCSSLTLSLSLPPSILLYIYMSITSFSSSNREHLSTELLGR